MTYKKLTPTNPLTDEELSVREVVDKMLNTSRLQVLDILDNSPTPSSQSSIQQSAPMSRQTLSTHLGELVDRGFVNHDRNGYKPTPAGTLLKQSIEYGIDEIGRDRLAYLTRSKYPIQLLHTVNESPTKASELSKRADTPSRSQIGQIFDTFEEYGWCAEDWNSDNGGRYYTKCSGVNVLDVFGEVTEAIAQLIEKVQWFLRLQPADAKLTLQEIRALADADLVLSSPNNNARVLWEALKFLDMRIDRVRAFCSIHDPTLIHSYMKTLNYGVDFEVILDSETHDQVRQNEETQYVLDDSQYSQYDLHCLDHRSTLGIGIYDQRKIAIGAYNETGRGNHIAMIHSSNDTLVEFGTDLFNSYQKKAHHPSPPPSDYPSPPSLFQLGSFGL